MACDIWRIIEVDPFIAVDISYVFAGYSISEVALDFVIECADLYLAGSTLLYTASGKLFITADGKSIALRNQ